MPPIELADWLKVSAIEILEAARVWPNLYPRKSQSETSNSLYRSTATSGHCPLARGALKPEEADTSIKRMKHILLQDKTYTTMLEEYRETRVREIL